MAEMGETVLQQDRRVTIRFSQKQFESYCELIGHYPKPKNWTDLIHRALGFYRDAKRVTPLEVAAKKKVRKK